MATPTDVASTTSYIYHYNCDAWNDAGYGCVYRNVQTLLRNLKDYDDTVCSVLALPTLMRLCGVAPPDPRGARGDLRSLWIEPKDAQDVLRRVCPGCPTSLELYSRDARPERRMLRTTLADFEARWDDPDALAARITRHLAATGGVPVIIDNGVSSYAIVGRRGSRFIIADPHDTVAPHVNGGLAFPGHDAVWMLLFVGRPTGAAGGSRP